MAKSFGAFLRLLPKYFLFVPISFIVGIVLMVLSEIFVYSSYYTRGEDVPLYASSTWSLFILFPAWTVISCIVLLLVIFIRYRKRSFFWKLHLLIVNALIVASPLLFILGSLQLDWMKKDAIANKLSQQVTVTKVSVQEVDTNLNGLNDKIEVVFHINSKLSKPLEIVRLRVGTLCVDTSNGNKQSFAVADSEEVLTILPGNNSYVSVLQLSEGNRHADWDRPVGNSIDIFYTLRDKENLIGKPFIKDSIKTNLNFASFEKESVDYTKGFSCYEPELIGN